MSGGSVKRAYAAIIVTGIATVACGGATQPSAATRLSFTAQPSSATAGAGTAWAVAVQDASGNTVTSATGAVTVALGANPGGGTLSGTTTVNPVNGVARLQGLSINKAARGYTLVASSINLPSATSAYFDITAAAATTLSFMVQPSAGTAVVTIRDAYSNWVTSATDVVTIALGANPTGGTLIGTTSVAAVDGTATFSYWSVDKCGVGYTLTASASGLVSATSTAFSITGCWSTKASMPTPRAGFAVSVVNGILYAVGGDNGGSAVAAVEAYNPTTNSWTTKAPMPTPGYNVAAGVVNGIIYVVGGSTGVLVQAYDPSTNTWTTKAPMPTAYDLSTVGVVNGILYAVEVSLPANTYPIGTFEAYDPTANSWTTKAPMPNPGPGLAVGVVNGILHAIGVPVPTNTPQGTVEAYDPTTNSWTTKPPMPTNGVTAAGVVNGILYAVVGSSLVLAYDTNSWTLKSLVPTPRGSAAVGVVNGILYVVGGVAAQGTTGTIVGTVEAYGP
jgi:hypothetical protein